MTSVTQVPETAAMRAGELDAADARATLRRTGFGQLAKDSFARFRYGDGFSHSRALALQFCLSFIPLVIALVGLSTTVRAGKLGQVLTRVLLTLTPGSSERVVQETLARGQQQTGAGGRVALVLGLVTAVVGLTTAMAQVERGANRIYGIRRDRPFADKYTRALRHAVTAGVSLVLGLLALVGGGALVQALGDVYGLGSTARGVLGVLRWPVGVALAVVSFTVLMRRAPRRRQPESSWIAVGAGVALVLWLVFTLLLVLYIRTSSTFGSTYGPLTGIVALLVWANLTSVALFLGVAFNAQLEAVRAGVPSPLQPDADAGPAPPARPPSG